MMNTRGLVTLRRAGWIGLGVLTISLGAGPLLKVPMAQGAHVSPIVITTIPVEVSEGAQSIAVNPTTNRIYVASQVLNAVSVIDGVTNTVATIPVGTSPHGIAVNPTTNRIYVAVGTGGNIATGELWVIDGASQGILAVIPMPGFLFPRNVAVNPTTNRVYVTNLQNEVRVFDGATTPPALITVLSIANPTIVAVNPVTNRIYVAREDPPIYVAVIDGGGTDFVLTPSVGSLGGIPVAIAVNPSSNLVYVTILIPGVSPTPGHVAVINGATNSVVTTVGVAEICIPFW